MIFEEEFVSHKDTKARKVRIVSEALDALAKIAVDCGYKLHEGLGPGLLESVMKLACSRGFQSVV